MLQLILPVAVGAVVGGLMGWFGRCTDGACPLTATWYRGVLFGAVIGLLFGSGSIDSR